MLIPREDDALTDSRYIAALAMSRRHGTAVGSMNYTYAEVQLRSFGSNIHDDILSRYPYCYDWSV
jgi:hypothetical protein